MNLIDTILYAAFLLVVLVAMLGGIVWGLMEADAS